MEYVVQGNSELVILNYETKEPVLYLPEAHLTHIDIEGDYRTTSGGTQGLDLLGWNRAAGDTFVIYTPLLSMKLLELSSGSQLQVNNNQLTTEVEQIEINNSATFETTYPPESIKVYQLNQSGYSILSKLVVDNIDEATVTLSSTTDGWLLVIYETISNIEELAIGKFINKGFFTIIGEVDIYNRNDATKEQLKFEFPKVNIVNSFNVKVLNNIDTGQVFTMQCQALVEDSIDKSLIRIIKRIDIEEPEVIDEWSDPVILYSYGDKVENWYLTASEEGAYAQYESDHILIGDKGYANFRLDYQPETEEEFTFYPPFIPSNTYTKLTMIYDSSGGASTSILFILDPVSLDMLHMIELDLSTGVQTVTIDLFDGIESPTVDFTISILAYSNRELKIYEIKLHN